ncbi:hypothetical protein OG439_08010 [Amycolatopsis sp. NBC_01307]|uniref:hypothetical protein n=1 Tax=Amycolatopsis sp. NBC_01307 TaxID=2903561 RepID=UPI002E10FCA9|nr:hypothetical protein OG439_08010 [Amycolatopsis sp. NBC_01307]
MTKPKSATDLDLTFLPPDFTLGFVVRESRPNSLKELLGKDRRWRRLFTLWLPTVAGEAGPGAARAFAEMSETYDRTGKYPDLKLPKANEREWNGTIGRFREFCGQIRDHLAALAEQVEQERHGVPAGTLSGGFSWLPPDMRVRFVVEESRPKNLRELMKHDNPDWRNLFTAWLAGQDPGSAKSFTAIRKWFRNHGRSYTALAKELGKADESAWNSAFPAFLDTCAKLREKIDARVKAAKKTDAGVEAERRLAGANTAGRVARFGPEDVKGLITVETKMLAATAELKPVFAETYSAYVKAEGWKTRGEATKLLETAYTALMSCEGELRRTTGVLRGLDPKRVAGRDTRNDPGPLIGPAQYEELGRAWQHYLAALENLGDATVRAAKLCDEWARKSTAGKLKENFASAFPVVNGCLLGAETLVWTLRMCVVSAGLGGVAAFPLAPEVTALVSSAISAAHTIVAEMIRGLVAYSAAGDRETVERHLGAEYAAKLKELDAKEAAEAAGEDGAPGTGSAVAGGMAAGLPGVLDVAARTAIKTLKDDAAKMKVVAAMPVVGEVIQGLGLIVKWGEQLNPKELRVTEPERRERLLTALQQAWSQLDAVGEDPDREVTVHSYDAGHDAFYVDLNGERGWVWNGRFTPDDRRRAAELVVKAFERESEVFQVDEYFLTALGPRNETLPMTVATLTEQFLGDEDGYFYFQTHVRATVGRQVLLGHARIAVSAEGRARISDGPHPLDEPGDQRSPLAVLLWQRLSLEPVPDEVPVDFWRDLLDSGLQEWAEKHLDPLQVPDEPLYFGHARSPGDGLLWRIHSADDSFEHGVPYPLDAA